jgi:fatty-acid desaturase
MVSGIHKNTYAFCRSIAVLQSSFVTEISRYLEKCFAKLVVCIIFIVAVMIVVAATVVVCVETFEFYFGVEKFML